jgi:formate dehydrogenase subunit gamma
VVAAHRSERGALMPILRALLDQDGYLDPRAVPVVAEELNLSRAEVHGVVTFYKDFRPEPPGRRHLQLCRAEACQAVGADAVLRHATRRLGVQPGQTTADGAVTLEEVFCLGNCALGPSALVDGRLVGRVDAARLDALLAQTPATAGQPHRAQPSHGGQQDGDHQDGGQQDGGGR